MMGTHQQIVHIAAHNRNVAVLATESNILAVHMNFQPRVAGHRVQVRVVHIWLISTQDIHHHRMRGDQGRITKR